MPYQGNNLTTLSHRLFVARGEADENGAVGAPAAIVLATAGDFAQKPATALDLFRKDLLAPRDAHIFPEMVQNGISFMFSGGSAADKTFTYNIYVWGNENGPAMHILQGTGTLGTQEVVVYPHNGVATGVGEDRYWADTLSLTWESWVKEVEVTETTGRNSIAQVWFDAAGVRYVFVEIADADGSTGTQAGDVAVYYRYF